MNNIIYTRAIWLLFNKSCRRQIAIKFDTYFAKEVMKRAKPNYFKMIRRAPAVGKHNPMLINIMVTAFVASIYKAGEGKIAPEQMGTIMTSSMESVSLFRKFFEMNDYFSKGWQDKRNEQALRSQQREYQADFVSEFIYGKTVDEYGLKNYECGIYKLLKREDCVELAPQMCKFDHVMAKYMNANLKLTKTLATGGDFCDFWYTKRQ